MAELVLGYNIDIDGLGCVLYHTQNSVHISRFEGYLTNNNEDHSNRIRKHFQNASSSAESATGPDARPHPVRSTWGRTPDAGRAHCQRCGGHRYPRDARLSLCLRIRPPLTRSRFRRPFCRRGRRGRYEPLVTFRRPSPGRLRWWWWDSRTEGRPSVALACHLAMDSVW